ncbi:MULTISPECIES: urease accessory UreF family protein [Cyanophyceae]|uniref:urease accessory protein UreF n=1 Tax=Cyanophyceae TaxID=3028117 RepID=UPI0016874CE9|nr:MULTISPECIES: urease accessory UreF family protein [Cyanophyceae]MBD1918422.1 urease accessory protein UreF [Phormidium sp. FACHB-77]MBD2028709.1 urease accessory protein UreF [Phormidium sp. FACHB-322]MBD2051130.1 urease accessory protein UreF [Leptolyngbya sp. FACHB-60]
MTTTKAQALLRLLQLTSPALPVGAYSYSEGLETLVEQGIIATANDMLHWLTQELTYGLVVLDGAAVGLVHSAAVQAGLGAQPEFFTTEAIARLNQDLSALRDSEEIRQQSWDMGRALVRMGSHLHPDLKPWFSAAGSPCNFAVAFALLAARWEIDAPSVVLGYLHSWAANLVTSAVKLIPLGQTVGQQMLLELYPVLEKACDRAIATQALDELSLSSWGTSLATMQHEVLYTRLFRS